MSTSSESLDILECCEFSLLGILLFSADSGTWTESGKGEVGSGLCAANALAPKLARVGVVASSIGLGGCPLAGAVLGRGVMGEAIVVSSLIESAGVSGVFTGRNVAAIMKAYDVGSAMQERNQDGGMQEGAAR
jgi:hypothetical protein